MTYVGWVKHDCYIICTLIVKIVGHQLIQHETWIYRCVYILNPPKHQAFSLDPPHEDVIFHWHTSGWNLLGCLFQFPAMIILVVCLSPNKHISWKNHVHLHVNTCNKYLSMKEGSLLALPVGKRLHICARFVLGDKILVHSLANVEMTSVHKMKFFIWM